MDKLVESTLMGLAVALIIICIVVVIGVIVTAQNPWAAAALVAVSGWLVWCWVWGMGRRG